MGSKDLYIRATYSHTQSISSATLCLSTLTHYRKLHKPPTSNLASVWHEHSRPIRRFLAIPCLHRFIILPAVSFYTKAVGEEGGKD